ncbi:MAG TPA: glycine--tRNA ligase subunit beta [Nitrospiraceae bacterium]|nr:glycine--tRNA ligase subunit beta [Nitrospiraceae bacterium]
MTPDMKGSSLLMEIGTEEIPARFIAPALTMLREKAGSVFSDYSIDFSDAQTYGTPRRLVLLMNGLPPMQKDIVKELYGPPQRAAFDKDGNPSKAALGFAAAVGVEVSSLQIRKKDKGEYVVAIIQQKGIAVKELLPEILQKIILLLHFPKSMRWGNGSFRFVRPIHWILALCDREVIPFELDGIKSANLTKGHRFLSPGVFIVREIPTYLHLMENNYVIVDQAMRKKIIAEGVAKLSSSVGGLPVKDEELLDAVTYLTEYPVPFLCEFPHDYLRLPRELLITVMRDHQKFFAVEDEQGRLKNHFIVVSNTKAENAETVRAGAERVIKARFEDARFYYEEDLKTPLHSRIEDLKRVTFHDRIGSLFDKTEKVVKLASFLAERLLPESKHLIERAALLGKTDLISGVVSEFPELQGLMGRYYALNDGEDRAVAEAIVEQYLPSHSGDRLPATVEGSLLSLADKIDSIVSFFAVGITPTGSEDPFALRRQALAVIAILMEKRYPLILKELFSAAEQNLKETRPTLADELLQFFLQRIEPLLTSQNFETDVIQSIVYLIGDLPPAEIKERLLAISQFTADTEYNAFLLAIKRVNNIIPDQEIPPVNENLLIEIPERNLYHDILTLKPIVQGMLRDKRYHDALKLLSALTGPINGFFDAVLVMDKREEVKLNRLALLKEIWKSALTIADFSKLLERAHG